MPEDTNYMMVAQQDGIRTTTQQLEAEQEKKKKNVHDWTRDMRMSADVNGTTVGVDTDRVTPDLMLATSKKLLQINRREADPDEKDSLQFQRIYGPTDYFAEHIMRDAGRLGRQLLWKATNRKNLDFMPTNVLDQHVSDVFNGSKLANMVDASSPLESVESSFKVSRLGEGGVGSIDSAPTEMRLVQPSFAGYISPVATPESLKVGLDGFMTKHCMKGSDGKLYQKMINAHTGKEELVDSVTAAKSIVTTPEMMAMKTNHIYAMGGRKGVRIVNKADVDYYLPRADEMFTNAENLVPMISGVKELRLRMGCLHPLTNMLVIDKANLTTMVTAKELSAEMGSLPGANNEGAATVYKMRTTIAKFPGGRNWFRKVVLYSGRAITTSKDHRWVVFENGAFVLKPAEQLKPGDRIPRSMFTDHPDRRTFINKIMVDTDTALLLGYAVRSLEKTERGKLAIQYQPHHEKRIIKALARHGIDSSCLYITSQRRHCVGVPQSPLRDWLEANVGVTSETRRVPSAILSTNLDRVAAFVDGFTSDPTLVASDSLECIWLLSLPNTQVRDSLSFLLARMRTDTYYRDTTDDKGNTQLALKLVEMTTDYGDCVLDEVKKISVPKNAPVMIDVDIDDNMYALANGVITHNSKYPQQAISLDNREAPLVRQLDERDGIPLVDKIGKFLGARYMPKPGTVTAVRNDRIDVLYDDGTQGSVSLYRNFPMNAKGYIDNIAQVKAGQHVGKGGLLASSNYTDAKGNAALGTNMRIGWLSWKGGTYEDAIVISESAAKKLTSTTMYSTGVDLDKTVELGKSNYLRWKPGEFTKEQLETVDDEGIVKPGTLLHKGDPVALAVQVNEPSPGTLGKRILTDVSATWEHESPGVVTDIMRTRSGIKVLTKVTSPAQIGDKLSNGFGGKGVISKILPDDEMPQDKDGKPLELLMSPLGLITRVNGSQLHEAMLGKIAHSTGVPEQVHAFTDGDLHQIIIDKLKQHHIRPEDDFFDPETGRRIPNVVNGYGYIYKLKHMAESKMSARGTGEYNSDDVPGGRGYDASKRYGMLETSALAGHGAFANLLDNKLIRGQSNADFWRSVRTGGIPTIPGEPLVHKKWFAYLQGSGVNVRKTPKGISVFALSNSDVDQLAGSREVKSRDTYDSRSFRPIDGGLFGQDIFGVNGDRWGYIQLDEPVPNPVMAEPLARLLRLSDKDFVALAKGSKTVDGMSTGVDMKKRLAGIDLAAASKEALKEFKDAPASKKDETLKRYVAVENMRRAGLPADQYMLDRIPVLPPRFRPVSAYRGTTMVADANYLYAQLLDARDDMREAKGLPKEYMDKARANLYTRWQELTGMYDPEDVKLRSKNVGGLLQWALGKGSPKFSAVQQKVIGTAVDTVGRGAIIPNSRLTIDQIGLPVDLAMDAMAPFVSRELVNRGYTPVDAMKMVKKRAPQAMDALDKVVATHPVEMNRAPTLHKYNIMAFKPVLVRGDAIQVNPSVCPGFNADFDGDSMLNLTRIVFDVEKFKRKFEKSTKNELTRLESALYYAYYQNQGDAMISDSTKCQFATATASLSELPTVPGSEIRKSDTVTEWDVPDGFYFDTIDPATGAHELARITKVSRHMDLVMYDCTIGIRGHYTHIATASEDHSLITINPDTLEYEKTKPEASLKRLVPYVIKNKGNDWEVCANYISIGKELPASYELGIFIGIMLGDGWVNCQNLAFIACCDKSLQTYILDLMNSGKTHIPQRRDAVLQEYGPLEARFSDNARGRIAMYIDWKVCDALHKAIGDGAENKHIPEDSMMASRAHLIGILMGLLATDGAVTYAMSKAKKTASKAIAIHTISPLLRDGIQELCARLGIKTGATRYRGPHSKSDCYAVTLSIVDFVKALKANPTYFRIPMATKQATLEKIIPEVENSESTLDFDLVPFPGAVRSELIYAGANIGEFKSVWNSAMTHGYIARKTAKAMVKLANAVDWTNYKEPRSVYARLRTHHTPEQAKALIDRWTAIVNDETVGWEVVESVAPSLCTEGWDCTVPGPYTFTLSTGTVVQDTVNIHVPVSDNARKEALEKMLPSKNLITPASHSIMNKPEKEYNQGLYIATRMGKSPDGRARIFRTYDEARDAYRRGEIDVDTPIQILENK